LKQFVRQRQLYVWSSQFPQRMSMWKWISWSRLQLSSIWCYMQI